MGICHQIESSWSIERHRFKCGGAVFPASRLEWNSDGDPQVFCPNAVLVDEIPRQGSLEFFGDLPSNCLPDRALAPWPDIASSAAEPHGKLHGCGFPFHIHSLAHQLDSYVESGKSRILCPCYVRSHSVFTELHLPGIWWSFRGEGSGRMAIKDSRMFWKGLCKDEGLLELAQAHR
jgi:hypothetical protein